MVNVKEHITVAHIIVKNITDETLAVAWEKYFKLGN